MVFGARLYGIDVRAEFLDDILRVAKADRAPVFRDRDVEIQKVMPVEDHVLPVDFRPAHPQAVDEGEILALHWGQDGPVD